MKTKQCEYVGHTGRRQCPKPATVPLTLNGHPIMYYCPDHAKEIHSFLTTSHPDNVRRVEAITRASILARTRHAEQRRERIIKILEAIQPATSGQLTRYAKALGTTQRTMMVDLNRLEKDKRITGYFKAQGVHGRTREWRLI